MIFVKTQAGQQALKDRHGGLSSRQRSAFILFDGKRTLDEVLLATLSMGISATDVQLMVDQGLLEAMHGGKMPVLTPSVEQPVVALAERSQAERFQQAYPIAIELTAGLGLRGFRLNLAVEGANGYDALAHLAPKIHEAVGEAGYARLKQVLFD